jgi:hypothetical protein
MCQARGLVTIAAVVDHITPHRGNWNAFLVGPFQSLCASCHEQTKKRIELDGYSPDIGDDGWPLDPKHPANSLKTRYG